MESKHCLSLVRIKSKQHIDASILYKILFAIEYDDDKGYGFQDLSIENTFYIHGTLIKRTPVYLTTFEKGKKAFTKVVNFLYSEIDFIIDLKSSLIEIYASQNDVNKFRNILKTTLNNYIFTQEVETFLHKFLPKLNDEVENLEIKKLLIKNFRYQEGVMGKYEANFNDSNLGWQLLMKYEMEVHKASVKFIINQKEVDLLIDNFGRLQIGSEEKEFNNSFNLIKSIISKI